MSYFSTYVPLILEEDDTYLGHRLETVLSRDQTGGAEASAGAESGLCYPQQTCSDCKDSGSGSAILARTHYHS